MPKGQFTRKSYPLVTDLPAAARVHTHSALRVLASIACSPKAPAMARVAAASILLDRGWGKVANSESATDVPEIRIIIRHILDNPNNNLDGNFIEGEKVENNPNKG